MSSSSVTRRVTRSASWCTCSSIVRFCSSLSRSHRLSMSDVYPFTEVSGLRSSWETVEMMAMPLRSPDGRSASTVVRPAERIVAVTGTSVPSGRRNIRSTWPSVDGRPSRSAGTPPPLRTSKASPTGWPMKAAASAPSTSMAAALSARRVRVSSMTSTASGSRSIEMSVMGGGPGAGGATRSRGRIRPWPR